jgi:hypothetical protein
MRERIEFNGPVAAHGVRLATANDEASRAFSVFTHPDDVMSSPALTRTEKRAILASWVSDVRAVMNQPALRQLDNGAVVQVRDVLRALKSLDDADTSTNGHTRPAVRQSIARQRHTLRSKWLRRRSRRSRFDDDDDPPPRPVSAAIPVRLNSQSILSNPAGRSYLAPSNARAPAHSVATTSPAGRSIAKPAA